ncbi:MAG: hypothetical protein RR420_00785 [Anaerovoracaceae bacterium]
MSSKQVYFSQILKVAKDLNDDYVYSLDEKNFNDYVEGKGQKTVARRKSDYMGTGGLAGIGTGFLASVLLNRKGSLTTPKLSGLIGGLGAAGMLAGNKLANKEVYHRQDGANLEEFAKSQGITQDIIDKVKAKSPVKDSLTARDINRLYFAQNEKNFLNSR